MTNDNTIMAGIRSDNALSIILSNFDTNFIVNMVKDSINMRFRPYETALPSLYSIESSFNSVLDNTDNTEAVMEVREKTYEEIINEVCYFYGLQFNRDYNVDIYSTAYWIYDFFVSNFTSYFFNFLTNYIYINKTELNHYIAIDPNKDKNSSLIYAKNIITDKDLANLHANLGTVLEMIFSLDITFEDLLRYSISNDQLKVFLHNIVKDINGTLFKEKYASLFYTPYRTDIITNVKLKIQDAIIQNAQLLKQN